jgi:hypothetical protein
MCLLKAELNTSGIQEASPFSPSAIFQVCTEVTTFVGPHGEVIDIIHAFTGYRWSQALSSYFDDEEGEEELHEDGEALPSHRKCVYDVADEGGRNEESG